MTPYDIALEELKENGYQFDRHGRNHDIYYNPELNCKISVKRHKFTEDTLRYIRKEINENKRGRGN